METGVNTTLRSSRGELSAGRSTAASRFFPETIIETNDELDLAPDVAFRTSDIDPVAALASSLSSTSLGSRIHNNNQPEQASTPLRPSTPPKSSGRPTLTSSSTPMRLSTSNTDPECTSPSESSSHNGSQSNARRSRTLSHRSQQELESNKITQMGARKMEHLSRQELDGNVYEHTQFFDEYLMLEDDIHRDVCNRIRATAGYITSAIHLTYDEQSGRWGLSDTIAKQTNEKQVYFPLATLLNAIGREAFHIYRRQYPNDDFRLDYTPFLDHSSRTALWDSPSDAATNPDLVKSRASGDRSHCNDMELVIECKSQSDMNSWKDALMQILRYARTVFARQIYRLRVFGFSLCGSIVNFVCIDRSGLHHSSNIDLSTANGADEFVRHIIALLTIPAAKFGYNTRYSINRGSNPPQTLFAFPGYLPQVVQEVLCHRKCSCGRATWVCSLGDMVHKSIWRPSDRTDEGEMLDCFESVFAVCQLVAHDCSMYSTKLRYPDTFKRSPAAGYFSSRGIQSSTTSISSNLDIQPHTGVSLVSSAASAFGPACDLILRRGIRVKSDILMQRGTSLFRAQNPLHLAVTIHDALLGERSPIL